MFEVDCPKQVCPPFICCIAVTASLAHGVRNARQESLGYGKLMLLQPREELLSVGRERVVFQNSSAKISP